ncbi:MAG: RNA-directed DNA polymerase [Candidatus Aminicenantes bacterium]|nr:RNA-directed DNA polymerase [Candidatus Aminicenantes bacterium]
MSEEHSFLELNRLFEAFEKVRKNRGCAGADGVTIPQYSKELFQNLTLLKNDVRERRYLPFPLLKILVDKGYGEARSLCIPCVRDRVLQTTILDIVGPILENEFENGSYAYRQGRSVKQAVQQVRFYYEQGYKWVVDADIDAFFDSVDHSILFQKINEYISNESVTHLIRLWIKGEIWDGSSISIPTQGIPQGSPISPILANLFLDELDETLEKENYKYVRYADDFLVLCKSADKAGQALRLTEKILEELELELDEADIKEFSQGFKFLGVIFVNRLVLKSNQKKSKKIFAFPPPLNKEEYILLKKEQT